MFFHMTNKNMKDFRSYLLKYPYVFLDANDEKILINKRKAYAINSFIKIIVAHPERSNTYYDLSVIKRGVKSIINKKEARMFLDLEFCLPSSKKNHIPEIIQYGMIVEDEEGKIVLEDTSLVRPLYRNSLNKRTLKFLSLNLKDFNNACSYIKFYQLLEMCIKKYDVKIIAWGKNDALALEQSFKLNYLQPLDVRSRYMNLMQVMKNYYNYKQEIGLFNTYQELTKKEEHAQSHNAFEDALIAREIFYIFKERINKEDI